MQPFYLYILKCSDGSYYTGHTDNIEKRISEHTLGVIKGYTSKRLPVKVVYVAQFASRYEAIAAERKIKGWSRKKKKAFICNDWKKINKINKEQDNKKSVQSPSSGSGQAPTILRTNG